MEIMYGKAGRHIPKARREEKVWPYLYGFEVLREENWPEIETLCHDGLTFDAVETDDELKNRMPEGFIRWCCFNFREELRALCDVLEEKENWWHITQSRAEGKKLVEIGEQNHLTSERVRQICNLLVSRTEQKGGMEILAQMAAINGYTDCLTEEEMEKYLGRRSMIMIYLLTSILEKNEVWYYWPRAHVIVLEGARETAEKTEAYVQTIPDVVPVTSLPEVGQRAEAAGYSGRLVEQLIRHTYQYDGHNYHRGAIQTQHVCEDIMHTYFSHGIYIYDAESLRLFREKAREKYGPNCPVPENDHAMTVLLNRISMLRNRGIYIPAKKGVLPKELLDRIRRYMKENGQVSYMYNTLYGAFHQELLEYGVDNRYYLQGILKQEFGDEYTITRDYITTGQEDKQLKDPVIRYIRDAGRMVTKEELAGVFHTSPYLAYNCALMDRSIINYFGQYMHVDNLGLTDEEKDALHDAVDALLSDGKLHETKELLKILRRSQPQLVRKAHLDAPYPVFSLVNSLMGDEYVLNRPYMALRGSEGEKQITDIKGIPGTRTKMHTSMPKHRTTAGPEKILEAIENSGSQGITLQELHRMYHVTKNYIANVCEDPKVIGISDRYLSADSIQGLDAARETFYQIIDKELRENGVARRERVCELIRGAIPEFFEQNRLTEADAPFFMTKYLFQKLRYRDVIWYFHPHNRSISLKKEESDVTLMGQVMAYCRRVQRPVTMGELTDRLSILGYNTDNLKYNLHLCEDPFLFVYGEDTYVLVESIGITDRWIDESARKLKQLFQGGRSLIPYHAVRDEWLCEQMPPIPMGLAWNRYFLQQLCCFYGERMGARTIWPIGVHDFNQLHSFIVSTGSPIRTPSDAVWAWMVHTGWSGKTLRTEEFMSLLQKERIIADESLKKAHRFSRTLDNPAQFKWNASETRVVIVPPPEE